MVGFINSIYIVSYLRCPRQFSTPGRRKKERKHKKNDVVLVVRQLSFLFLFLFFSFSSASRCVRCNDWYCFFVRNYIVFHCVCFPWFTAMQEMKCVTRLLPWSSNCCYTIARHFEFLIRQITTLYFHGLPRQMRMMKCMTRLLSLELEQQLFFDSRLVLLVCNYTNDNFVSVVYSNTGD